MKILFQSRKTLFTVPGGDTVQLMKTADALRSRGCTVDVSTDLEPDLSGYDLVHLFNLMRPQEVYLQAYNAKLQGKKVALSTIYGLYTEYDQKARTGIPRLLSNTLRQSQIEYLKILARAVKNVEVNKGTLLALANGYKGLQNKLVDLVDVFLPNSESEMNRVRDDFPNSAHKPYVVVPNAVDTKIFNPELIEVSPEVEQYRGCVLSVARIEGRKCQLQLVRAMRDLPWKLVLIGKPAPNHMDYYEQVKKEAGPNVILHGQVDHDLLPQFYKAAKVHCLISWMETPGLSSLEAGIMGCNLVVTEKGDTRDYFGNCAYYCEPDSVSSIRDAIIKAYRGETPAALQEKIACEYSWEKAAEKSMEGYRKVFST